MTNKIIFVGGIHGVGKTWLCEKLVDEMEVKHFSASQLIKDLKKNHSVNNYKGVKNINNNQKLLLLAVNQYADRDLTIILDGHFCLLNLEHEIKQISKETFVNMSPIAIIVLYDSILNISKKISNRDGVRYDIDLLSSFQDEEIKYSEDVAKYLQVPYLLFDVSDDIAVVKEFIVKLIDREI